MCRWCRNVHGYLCRKPELKIAYFVIILFVDHKLMLSKILTAKILDFPSKYRFFTKIKIIFNFRESWHEWSAWSQCPICGRNATQQRYRACDGSRCKIKTELEKRKCQIPDCHDELGCRVNTQLRNFTRNGCLADNVVVNYCSGR